MDNVSNDSNDLKIIAQKIFSNKLNITKNEGTINIKKQNIKMYEDEIEYLKNEIIALNKINDSLVKEFFDGVYPS